MAQVRAYHDRFGSRRESAGDLIAQEMTRGPYTLDEVLGMHKQARAEIADDLDGRTREARQRLLETAQEMSGGLVIARSALIVPLTA